VCLQLRRIRCSGRLHLFNEKRIIAPDVSGPLETLKDLQRVSYEITTGPKTKQASNIQPA